MHIAKNYEIWSLIDKMFISHSYMDYLNSWGFWEKRADLEIKIANLRSTNRSPRTVYLSCNFCGKSVSNALQEDARIRNISSNVNKVYIIYPFKGDARKPTNNELHPTQIRYGNTYIL